MRDGRRWRVTAGVIATLLLAAACTGSPPAASISTNPLPSPSAPLPSASGLVPAALPTLPAICSMGGEWSVDNPRTSGIPGTPITVRIREFPPTTVVTLRIGSVFGDDVGPPIGTAMTDAAGVAMVSGVIPADTPFGDTSVSVTVAEVCGAEAALSVVGSVESVGIDDDTVRPGQSVTLTASGYQPGDSIVVILDGDAYDLDSTGFELGSAPADKLGYARIVVRIPRDISAGRHFLTANGYSFDGTSDLFQAVNIKVTR
jgi:hypothetical protein